MTPNARVISLVLLAAMALLQVSVVQKIEFGDANPDLLILVVVSLALMSSSVDGAIFGFAAGMMLALFAALPLGPHAMVGTLVGYLAGRWGEQLVTDDHPVPPLVAGVVGTIGMEVGRPLVEFLVLPGWSGGDGVWANSAISIALGAALAIPVYVVTRRVLLLVGDEPAVGAEA